MDFDEKNQKLLCEQHFVKNIEVMNESYLTQSQADALIFGFLAADEENKREHDDRYVVAK